MKHSENKKYALVKRYYDGKSSADICAKKNCKKYILLLAKTV